MPTNTLSGLDLKVERVRARVTATSIAEAMGVTRQRVSAIEAQAVVTARSTERYRAALMSVTSDAETANAA